MKKRIFSLIAGLVLAAGAFAEPEYNENGELLLPEGYDTWVFVGTNLGLGYIEEPASSPPAFHNVFMEPHSYRAFMDTGKFAQLTQFLFEVRTANDREESGQVNAGVFNGELLAIEMSVKNNDRPKNRGSEEEWAYYHFPTIGGIPAETAPVLPDRVCWQCHEDHAGYDHVWVQLYPRLKERLEP